MKPKSDLNRLRYPIHPRPNPIAAALYVLRDLGCDAIILHGPSGCNFRALRLLERDGVKVFTTALSDMDVIMGGKSKLIEVLRVVYDFYNPKLMGVVGTCCTSIIGEDIEDEVREANLPIKVIAANVSACIGDNVEGALRVLEAAAKVGVIDQAEIERQKLILRKAAEIEKSRGVALPGYIEPSEGDNVDDSDVMLAIHEAKESLKLKGDVTFIANLMRDRGLPKVKADAHTILHELKEKGVNIDYFTGGLDEYALTNDAIANIVKEVGGFDFSIVLGIPQAVDVNGLGRAIGVSSGNRTMSRLRALGYYKVVNEEGAHINVLGSRRIVRSKLGEAIRREAMLRAKER